MVQLLDLGYPKMSESLDPESFYLLATSAYFFLHKARCIDLPASQRSFFLGGVALPEVSFLVQFQLAAAFPNSG